MEVIKNSFRQFLAFHRGRPCPVFFTWHITSRCNLQCRQCFFFDRMPDFGKDMDTETCFQVVDQLAEMHLPFLYFGGGEPLLREDLCSIADRAKMHGIRTILFTNGILITPRLASSLAKSFYGIFVSLEGPRTIHDSWRGEGAFDLCIEGLSILLDWKDTVQINLNISLDDQNVFHLEELFQFSEQKGIHKIQLHPFFSPEARVGEERTRAMEKELLRLYRKYPGRIDGSPGYLRGLCRFLSEDWQFLCQADTLLHPALLPDGKVSACCAFSMILGDVHTSTLRDILDTAPSFQDFTSCDGCYRQDYGEVTRLFRNPLRVFHWSILRRLMVG